MKEKRETLTQMLLALMEQKDARQNELKSRLNELEKHKSEETDNYWLIQYQKLLDSKPKVSVTEIKRTHVNRQGYKLRLYNSSLLPKAVRNISWKLRCPFFLLALEFYCSKKTLARNIFMPQTLLNTLFNEKNVINEIFSPFTK